MNAVKPVIIASLAQRIRCDYIRSGIGGQQKTFVKMALSIILIAPAMTLVIDGTVELRVVVIGP